MLKTCTHSLSNALSGSHAWLYSVEMPTMETLVLWVKVKRFQCVIIVTFYVRSILKSSGQICPPASLLPLFWLDQTKRTWGILKLQQQEKIPEWKLCPMVYCKVQMARTLLYYLLKMWTKHVFFSYCLRRKVETKVALNECKDMDRVGASAQLFSANAFSVNTFSLNVLPFLLLFSHNLM